MSVHHNPEERISRTVITSDYDPNTKLLIVRTEDGDVVLKIIGNGEMRIATSGGQFHGQQLVDVLEALSTIIQLTGAQNKVS